MADAMAESGAVDLPGYRALVVAGLTATVLITWPLWSVRETPPLLPVIALPHVSLGPLLLVACALSLAAPRRGVPAVTLLVVYGMLTDQTRMQPEFFSLPLLLWGSLPWQLGRLLARTHLVALWFFSGLHKLLSVDYRVEAGPRLLADLPFDASREVLTALAILLALVELSIGVLALFPFWRRSAAWMAMLLHAGILIAFVLPGEVRNVAVWPWNVVLAFSGLALIAPWRSRLSFDLLQAPALARAMALLILLSPVGFYLGVVDAYPAHNLYSSGTASATVYCPSGCLPMQDLNATWHAFRVPLPPQRRLFAATFDRTCRPGDVMRITDPHPPPWDNAAARAIRFCSAGTMPAAHP